MRCGAPAFPRERGRFICAREEGAGLLRRQGGLDWLSSEGYQPGSTDSPEFAGDIMASYTHLSPELIHGRIYAGPNQKDYLQSGRPKVATREIASAEVYQLANEIWGYRGAFMGPLIFRLPRAIAAYLNR